MSEHRMSSSEEENEAKRSPSKDQGKVSTISVTYCDEFLVHNLRTCAFSAGNVSRDGKETEGKTTAEEG